MFESLLQVLLGGVQSGAEKVMSDQADARKIAQQLELDKKKREQAMADDITKGVVLEAVKGNVKGKPLNIDPSVLPEPYQGYIKSLKSPKPAALGRGGFSRTPSAQPKIIDLNKYVK